ncbi:baseplate J/gp47 family protein, partial [Salmonella enterica]|nr:baseplate J/gp47 family protein [Salmonella enterica]
WLARHAAMKRCPRKGATTASGYMRWEGVSDGLKVTAGSVIQRDDLVQYTATADATSSGGVLRVPITCSTTGAVGNADDGTALILVTPVNGLPSSGVTDTLTGGFDTEDLETWRARVIERYYWTPQGGADGDYVVWAKEVPGITRAWTYRHWMGTGTVGVMIAGSDLINPIPEESTETAARQHIEPLAPVAGSDLYVFRPVAHTVDFHIRVTPDTPEIRAAITAELRSFLLRDGYPQGELKVSRISEAISGANGEYSHQLLAPVDNISIAKNELAVLGTISWT